MLVSQKSERLLGTLCALVCCPHRGPRAALAATGPVPAGSPVLPVGLGWAGAGTVPLVVPLQVSTGERGKAARTACSTAMSSSVLTPALLKFGRIQLGLPLGLGGPATPMGSSVMIPVGAAGEVTQRAVVTYLCREKNSKVSIRRTGDCHAALPRVFLLPFKLPVPCGSWFIGRASSLVLWKAFGRKLQCVVLQFALK